jgi:probable rRNA maturation factor
MKSLSKSGRSRGDEVQIKRKLETPHVVSYSFENVVISNRQRTKKINLRLLKKIIAAALTELKIEKAGLEINLVAVREMILVNETFLGHEGSTDVITFDYANNAGGGGNLAKRKLEPPHVGCYGFIRGEIFVCVDEAVLQSKKFRANWQSEIVRYIVHGVLHLLGHDDLKPDLRHKMKREENRLLRELSKRFSLAQISRPSKIIP